ncbi:hypothetical protein Hypma_002014 [Hypsizygus marmoreus]|uniref:Uncharacterized protein n=1 Tax=Hypsizygus marmoreus TaxID=39966 RepID=A0A369J7L4_HYPMA|nr:hypothetical protein Hypma_002014 [Hypsizygus marmoreus]
MFRFNLKPLLRIAFQNIIDFVLAKPPPLASNDSGSALSLPIRHRDLQSQQPGIRFPTLSRPWTYGRIRSYYRQAAASAVFRLEYDLASSNEERQPEELLAHREAWKEKIVRQLPLASRRGVLMTEAIPTSKCNCHRDTGEILISQNNLSTINSLSLWSI